MKKVALHNLGCKVNAYETEAMQELLEKHGYEIVPFQEGADVYIINTCTVTNMADRKSRQMLHKARKMNPDSIVVAWHAMYRLRKMISRKVLILSLVIIRSRILLKSWKIMKKKRIRMVSGKHQTNRKRKQRPIRRFWISIMKKVYEDLHLSTARNTQELISRCRTDATSSALTASFRSQEEG